MQGRPGVSPVATAFSGAVSETITLPSKVQPSTSAGVVVTLKGSDAGAGVAQPAVQDVMAKTAHDVGSLWWRPRTNTDVR